MAFTIRDIPAAMRANGWQVGAQVMERWFARTARAMTDAEKRGVVPSPDIETQMVTMAWALRFSRVADARDNLIKTWHREPRIGPTRRVIADRLRTWRQTRAPGRPPFRFGDLNLPTVTVDTTCQVNFEIVESSWFGSVDDFYAAMGNASVKLAISGMAQPSGPGRWQLTIDEIGTYIRDTYDFNGDQSLGQWNASGIVRHAILAPEIPVVAEGAEDRGGQYFRVNNDVFRAYRRHYGKGGDFVILSDVMKSRLPTPIVVEVAE